MRGLHFLELHHFWLTFRNSYTVRKWPMLRNLLWKYGAQVLVRDALRRPPAVWPPSVWKTHAAGT